MTDAPPLLRLFLDRSTQGKRFVEAVKGLVPEVQTINDRYGILPAERIPDTQWITEATADGYILLGADRNVLRNRLERHAICRFRARYVVFGTNNMTTRLMIELFARHLPHIEELTAVAGPWVYRIAQHGISRLALNCADLAS